MSRALIRFLCPVLVLGCTALVGCSNGPGWASTETVEGDSTSASTASPTTVGELRALILEEAVIYDELIPVPATATPIDLVTATDPDFGSGEDALVRADVTVPASDGTATVIENVVFNVVKLPLVQDVMITIVLDEQGLRLVRAAGHELPVRGERLRQLEEVFARTPHPDDPSEPKWGHHRFFAWPDGEAVAFLGHVFVRSTNGAISRFVVESAVDDPLDR